MNEVTRAAQLTPVGRGAIGVVGVRGPRALACVSRCFHSKSGYSLPQSPVGRILLGDWYPPATADLLFHAADRSHKDANRPEETAGEELIVCRVSSDEVEVHCHGGQAAVGNVLAALQQCGCELVPWSDFLIGPQDADLHAQAAWAALPRATTNRVAAVLLDQAQGALDQAYLKIEAALKERDAAMAAERIDAVLRYASVGCHLVEPWQIALVGPPNVGKSSLINALVGFERAVVHAEPGTTRDVVTAHSVIDGWPVQFSDTAGLRATDEPLEAEGIRRSLAESQQAELLVLVLDASCGLQALTDSTMTLQRQPDLVVWNKADLISDPSQLPAGCLLVSARTGAGLPELLVAVSQVLVPISPPPGAAVAWTTEQIQWLHAARLWAVAPMDPAC